MDLYYHSYPNAGNKRHAKKGDSNWLRRSARNSHHNGDHHRVMSAEAKKRADAIWGIWFEDRTECLRLTETIQGVLKEVAGHEGDSHESDSGYYGAGGKLAAAIGGGGGGVGKGGGGGGGVTVGSGGGGGGVGGPGGPGGPTGGGVKPPPPGMNILSLLSNAQNKYEKEHGASQDQGSDPKPIHNASAGDASGMSQISLDELFRTVNKHQAKAGLRDSSTATSNQRLPTNPMLGRTISVSEVEAQSQEPKGPPKVPPTPTTTTSSTTTPSTSQQQDARHPLLRLISSKTVEEIERQHREEHQRAKETVPGGSSIPAEAKPAAGKSSRSPGGATDGASVDLMSLLGHAESSHPIPIPLSSAAPSVSDLEHSMSSMTLPAMPDAPLADAIHGSIDPRTRKDSSSNGVSGLPMPTFLKPSDLDPSLGPKPTARTISSSARNSSKSPSNIPFLTPQAFADLAASSSSTSGKPEPPSPVIIRPIPLQSGTPVSTELAPLTKEQLQQAMLHMIKNDDDFVSNVHKAYLASFQTSTGRKS